MSGNTISIIGREDVQERGPLGKVKDWRYRHENIAVETIRSQLSDFLSNMRQILEGIPGKVADYELESMDISVEINSKGTVSLLAVGGELGSTGGLTLHLKKKASDEHRSEDVN